MQLEDVLSQLDKDLIQDQELKHICKKIVYYISSQPAELLQRITFGSLTKATTQKSKEYLLPAVQYLSGSRFPILEIQYMLIYENEEFHISKEELKESRDTGKFFHPDLGELIPEYENYIYIYFSLSPIGIELARGHKA